MDIFHSRYYRSGMEMARMAQVYMNEHNIENAFILYIKFSTLFLEKIITHPEYKSFDPTVKRQNKEKLKEIIPIAEKLKIKLKEKFQNDFIQYEKNRLHEHEREAASQKDKVNILWCNCKLDIVLI